MAGLLVVTGVLVGPAPGGAQVAPAWSISPATELRKGQEVTITATGLEPRTYWEMRQCGAPGECKDWDDRGIGGSAFGVAEDDGTLSTTMIVRPEAGGYPCRPVGCHVEARRWGQQAWDDIDIGSLEFVDPAKSLTVPAGPLLDATPIDVVGDGFDEFANYVLAQCYGTTVDTCWSPPAEPSTLLRAGGGPGVGNLLNQIRARVVVERRPTIGGVVRDCSGTTCHLGVIDPRGVLLVTTPLTFAAEGSYVWPPARLTYVSPPSNLRNTELLTVAAADLSQWSGVDEATVRIQVCRQAPIPG